MTGLLDRQPPELALRIVTGIGMIAVAMLALTLGGLAFWLLTALIGLAMIAEWADLHAAPARDKRLALYALFVPLALMSPLGAGPGFLALGLLAGAAFFVVIVTNRRALALGVVYVGLPVLSLLLIRARDEGVILALWALALVWATDIGAYAAGRLIGGPKLAPRLSPNKTWAGLIGGVALATLLALALHDRYGLAVRLVAATPVLAVAAQAGDLYESRLKRRAGVKDSGSLIPGHGGVLDRLDGVVPVAPLAALLVLWPALDQVMLNRDNPTPFVLSLSKHAPRNPPPSTPPAASLRTGFDKLRANGLDRMRPALARIDIRPFLPPRRRPGPRWGTAVTGIVLHHEGLPTWAPVFAGEARPRDALNVDPA